MSVTSTSRALPCARAGSRKRRPTRRRAPTARGALLLTLASAVVPGIGLPLQPPASPGRDRHRRRAGRGRGRLVVPPPRPGIGPEVRRGPRAGPDHDARGRCGPRPVDRGRGDHVPRRPPQAEHPMAAGRQCRGGRRTLPDGRRAHDAGRALRPGAGRPGRDGVRTPGERHDAARCHAGRPVGRARPGQRAAPGRRRLRHPRRPPYRLDDPHVASTRAPAARSRSACRAT